MTARRCRAGHRAGNRPERTAEGGGVTGGVQRTGPPARLQHDRGETGRRDEAVALQEAPLRRRRAAGQLRHHRALGDDPGQQGVVPARVEPVDTAGEEGHRLAGTRQRRPVRHPVDAVCRAGHDRVAAVDQARGRLHGDVFAVAGGSPGADQRDRPAEGRQCGVVPAHPQGERSVWTQVAERHRPALVSRHAQLNCVAHGLPEGDDRRARLQPGLPSLAGRDQFLAGERLLSRVFQGGEQPVRVGTLDDRP